MAGSGTFHGFNVSPFDRSYTVKVKVCSSCGRAAEPGVTDQPCPQCGCTSYEWRDSSVALPKCA